MLSFDMPTTLPPATDNAPSARSANAHWIALVEKQNQHCISWMLLAGDLLHLLKSPDRVTLAEDGQIELNTLKERYAALTAKVGFLEPATTL